MPRTAIPNLRTPSPTGRYECEWCGQRFDWANEGKRNRGKVPHFCSDDCQVMELVECAGCGDVVEKRKSRPGNRLPTCSLMCRYFVTNGRWQASPWPKPAPRVRLEPKPRPVRVALACRDCGAQFTTTKAAQVFCSRECKSRSAQLKRRAAKVAAFISPVHRQAIYVRDNWTCGLCGKKLKRGAAVPHPLAPTIDHVIPLAVGGTHEPANVQAAHFRCNSVKGARGGAEQLALIG